MQDGRDGGHGGAGTEPEEKNNRGGHGDAEKATTNTRIIFFFSHPFAVSVFSFVVMSLNIFQDFDIYLATYLPCGDLHSTSSLLSTF